ncbi:hypothetical protein VTN02DRAFT_3431 [Thermoascus thermophilus]
MSASGDFGPAPPGVDLSQNQDANILGAVITLMIIGVVAVVLRVLARMKTKDVNFALDDYLIFVALFFSCCTGICCFISLPHGLGRHMAVLHKDEFIKLWKILFAYVIIYATAVTCIKSSIVLFYRRVFNLHYSLFFAMFFVLGYWITVFVAILSGCRPLSYFWQQYTDPEVGGFCIDIPLFFYGNGIAAMLIDVIILCVPIPIVLGLQMPTSQKLAVIGILLLGSFVCVAGIVRIIMLHRITVGTDPTWTMAAVFVWSCVEPFIGIVCACLPTFAPFFRRWWSNVRTGKLSNSDSSRSKIGRESGSRLEWGRNKNADYSNLGPHGDEVQLTNEITGPATSMRTKESDEELSVGMNGITVSQDVDITWSHSAPMR